MDLKNSKTQLIKYIILIFFFYSCSTTYKPISYEINPIRYIYDFKINTIYNTIKYNYDDFDHIFHDERVDQGDSVYFTPYFQSIFIGSDSISRLRDTSRTNIFRISDNKYDFFIECCGYKNSNIFFNNHNSPYLYWVDFHIHLQSIDNNHTVIEVIAIEPRIKIGQSFFPTLPHLARPFTHTQVETSTIEEYEILLKIGELLGVKEKMPKCNYPEKPKKKE